MFYIFFLHLPIIYNRAWIIVELEGGQNFKDIWGPQLAIAIIGILEVGLFSLKLTAIKLNVKIVTSAINTLLLNFLNFLNTLNPLKIKT